MKNTTGNRRLDRVFAKALRDGCTGGLLDAYNCSVLNNGIACTIHTRISSSCNYWILETDEVEENENGQAYMPKQ